MKRQSQKLVIATGHPATSQAAKEILSTGGNAFDAAVAAGFVSTVAEPGLTSLGGGGFLLAKSVDQGEILFDFFVDTPGLGLPKKDFSPSDFLAIPVRFPGKVQIFYAGMDSVAVPGVLKGLIHVQKRLGRLPLKKVLKPAIAMARNGVPLNYFQKYVVIDLLFEIMTLTEGSKSLFTKNDNPLKEGDLYKNPDLADYLETLSITKGNDFYNGKYGKQMVQDIQRKNGRLTKADLSHYEVVEREPLRFFYRGFEVLTNPPPSFGGSLILLSLKLLEAQDFSKIRWGSSKHLKSLATVLEEVDRLRKKGIISPEQLTKPMHKQFQQKIRSHSGGTTHLTVADSKGNVATMTASNGQGCGYVVPGTGIMPNNMMGEDDLHPEGFHKDPPGIRISSMMAPTLVTKNGKVVLALGSGGSKRIRTAIFQVVHHVIDFKMSVKEAVKASRIHWDGEVLQVEPGFSLKTVRSLQNHWKVNLWKVQDLYFGGVNAAVPGKEGAGDPRRGGHSIS